MKMTKHSEEKIMATVKQFEAGRVGKRGHWSNTSLAVAPW